MRSPIWRSCFCSGSPGSAPLSKWNAFDLVITVALGSSFATALLSKSVSLVQGIVGFAVLILLQFVTT